ncbi:Uncharacterised protein [Dermatophilus congolensis]|uniref:Uncharacterized protein n=2 Tax=Dermatophilus congolensis TaxID=1863 RepID=A0AA46BPN5_9MICO|nr:Uncharacterised protein [Dermatophilus congolensis]
MQSGDMSQTPLPSKHSVFAAHFTDDIYDNVDDAYAPFGSPEGEDLLRTWGQRRSELEDGALIEDLVEAFGDDLGDRIGEDEESTDLETLVVAAGFTILRLVGEIDEQDRQYVLRALAHLEEVFGEQPEFDTMNEDLSSFDG